ncbi:methyltransferase domain-containing protein [Patiriisocius hiemis]|uniref:Methyltransferase domain-containing protein n=1 Tax=Patiriisocius hiemis TaxID=3075604 RepID=A0ABU2Y9H0_9FLAO|nr:methyltransferase domain-containing protein [Constantimarinum sp. W242]MDT0554823.1 methyltransferase domain-containing protein [Constantimarinum sp. W242]
MITYSKHYRSSQEEIMDNFSLQGDELSLLLTDLRTVNSLLGGTTITLNGIKKLLEDWDKKKPVTILDLGCGDGEMLRQCSALAKKKGFTFNLVGVDANKHIIAEAKNKSKDFKAISYTSFNIFQAIESDSEMLDCDIILCTLFLHHFNDEAIEAFLKKLSEKSKVGIIINDLHRNRLAFTLFKVFSFFFIKTKIAKHDGLVSVARAFKKRELQKLASNLNHKSTIKWRWAFRYQWIISTKHNLWQ